jgi:hypothetical protein
MKENYKNKRKSIVLSFLRKQESRVLLIEPEVTLWIPVFTGMTERVIFRFQIT